jgi:HAD superfamily hydrolase (TIGR01509 family)
VSVHAGDDADLALPPRSALGLVICDCDGVLFESYAANVAFYDAVLAAAGLPPLDEAGRRLCHTLSSTQLFTELFADHPHLVERVRRTAQDVDYGPFYELMEPVPDLVETLRRLADHCPLALATNRGRTVEGVVTRFALTEFFRVRVGVLDVAQPKPAPDMLLRCLERTGVPAERAVYVGDSPTDRIAARAAGMAYVSVGGANDAPNRVAAFRDVADLLVGAA